MGQRRELDEHIATLRTHSEFTGRTLRSTGRLLEIFIAEPEVDPQKIDALRSQMRACQRAIRTSTQLLAQAAQLLEGNPKPQEAQRRHEHPRDSSRSIPQLG